MQKRIKIIIDCDPGCDDIVALVTALTTPWLEVIGITTVRGNVPLEVTYRNALGLTALMNRTDVPAHAGASEFISPLTPALEEMIRSAPEKVHGTSGVASLVLPFERAVEPTVKMDAVDFILEQTRHHEDDPITLVVIGPMTNIANAYLRDPTIVNRVKEIVTLGGAYRKPAGNITPFSEFNIYCDPEAANIVYNNFKRIRAIPLDVTYTTYQGPAERAWLAKLGALGTNLANMLADYANQHPTDIPGSGPMHDFHTIALLNRPLIYHGAHGRVTVETEGEKRGQTIFLPDSSGNVKVMRHVDERQFDLEWKACMRRAARFVAA